MGDQPCKTPECPAGKTTCEFHFDHMQAFTEMTTTVKGIIKSNNRVFMVGVALVVLAITAIFGAGQMHNQIKRNSDDIAEIRQDVKGYHAARPPISAP